MKTVNELSLYLGDAAVAPSRSDGAMTQSPHEDARAMILAAISLLGPFTLRDAEGRVVVAVDPKAALAFEWPEERRVRDAFYTPASKWVGWKFWSTFRREERDEAERAAAEAAERARRVAAAKAAEAAAAPVLGEVPPAAPIAAEPDDGVIDESGAPYEVTLPIAR